VGASTCRAIWANSNKRAVQLWFIFEMQGRDKKSLDGGEIGQALVLFKASNLRFTISDGNREFELSECWRRRRYLNKSPKVMNELS